MIECLRYFIPFKHMIKAFAQKIAECPKPQMVGYLVEYLVAFALVAKTSGTAISNNKVKACQDLIDVYLRNEILLTFVFPIICADRTSFTSEHKDCLHSSG